MKEVGQSARKRAITWGVYEYASRLSDTIVGKKCYKS